MDNSQIENTINEIRKRSGAVMVFNKIKCFVTIQFVRTFLRELFIKILPRNNDMKNIIYNKKTNLLEIEELSEIKDCFRIEDGILSSPSGEDRVLKSNGNIFKPTILQLGYAITTIGHIDEIRYPQSMGFEGYEKPKNFFIDCLEAKKVTREIRQKYQLR